MLDASVLSEWVFHWRHGSDPHLRTHLFQAGTRIRQYEIPVYIVETADEQLLREIFYRINNFGQSLKWNEVHDALFGRRGDHPSTLRELAAELQKLGMGRPEERDLLSCVTAFKGLDVTRNISEHYRKDADVLTRAVQEALPAVRGRPVVLPPECRDSSPSPASPLHPARRVVEILRTVSGPEPANAGPAGPLDLAHSPEHELP